MSIETAPGPTEGRAAGSTTTQTPPPPQAKPQPPTLQLPLSSYTPASGDALLGDEIAMMGCDVEAWTTATSTAAGRPQFLAPPQAYSAFAAPPAALTRHMSLPAPMVQFAVLASPMASTPMAGTPHHQQQHQQQQHHVQTSIPMLARHHSVGYVNMVHMASGTPFQAYGQPMMARSPHMGEMQHMLQLSMAQQQHVAAPHTPSLKQQLQQLQQQQQQHMSASVNVEPIAFTSVGDAKLPLEDLDPLAFAVFDRPMPQDIQQVESAFESLDRLLPEVEQELLFRGHALDAFAQTSAPLVKHDLKCFTPMSASSGKSPKSMAVCKVGGCGRRVRSKGFCKTHGGGRKCSIDGCKKSSQNGDFCIGHGGGKKCKEDGCAKAAQSHGLCKAHGGGARCKFPDCSKSSQGGGLCRAHGGGKRCQAQGCPKGAQRGNFCATHGGFRNCKIDGCVRTDRGGGFCEVHRRGRLCKVDGCKKLSRNQGMCTMHIREVKQEDGGAGASSGCSDAGSASDVDGVSTALSAALVV